VFDLVQAQKSACAPAYTAEQFFNSPQTIARDYLVEIEHPDAGVLKYPGLPYQFSKTGRPTKLPAPKLGQHNEEVLAGRLGYSKQDLVKLKQAGVI
jgi:crotonobetainyl-CoA:carnitine CoA-transferase CaiB-like acyl-CoA transferase